VIRPHHNSTASRAEIVFTPRCDPKSLSRAPTPSGSVSFLYDQAQTLCTGARPTVLLPQLSYVFTADKPDSSNLANANMEYTYDCVNQVAQVYDAVAIQKGTRGPYDFFLADGTRGERDDPLGQAYTVGYDTYGHPSRRKDNGFKSLGACVRTCGRVSNLLRNPPFYPADLRGRAARKPT
jgi:YD repeat-containing protein